MKHSEAFVKLIDEVMPFIREISCQEVLAKLEGQSDFFLVDVREDSEWSAGRLKGSMHIGRGVLERDIEKEIPDKQMLVVLYCGGGFRSALAAYNAQKMGYDDVMSMAGGIRRWRELAYPEEAQS
ncbi:MAG: hypothetical protein K8F91_03050 [Candidatus Obscuribacterales bacterium]|nr:hypothetical protein [Candidatus Obscuribacterales bacterium]